MSLRARVTSLVRSVLRRRRLEGEMEAELQFHMAAYADDLVRSGIAPRDAERRARVEFGSAPATREECREALGLRLLDEAIQDLAYARRVLWRNPGFAAIAIFTLAIGIGLNSACFTILDAWVLRPLPYPHPERLAAIWSADPKHSGPISVSAADLYDWRRSNAAFETICGWTMPLVSMMRGDEPLQLNGVRVNAEFFQMLGVTPQMGRAFLPQDDRPDASRVAILSDGLWHDAFAADPNVVGRSLLIDGKPATVIGILPPAFHLPLMGRAGIWMPLALSEADRADRSTRFLSVAGRIRPGVRMTQGADYLKTVASRLEKDYPATNAGRTVTVTTLQDEIGRKTGREPNLFCFGLVGCVLLLACANVANLIVGRALGRQREMAIRLAIGAGRYRLLRQLLTENLLLFFVAAVFSVAFAVWGTRWIQGSLSQDILGNLPNFGIVRVDRTVLLYTFGVALAMGLLFGFAPAAQCWRRDVNRGTAGGGRLKELLVVLQMSLALTVVVAAGLMVKGMTRMYQVDPGFDADGLVTARVVLADAKYADPVRIQAFFDRVLERIASLTGVQSAAAAQFVPYQGNYRSIPYQVDGADRALALSNAVTPSYFTTMGIALLRGRIFSAEDCAGSTAAGMINETMARRHWAHGDPIGRRLYVGAKLDQPVTIVGVVRDTLGQTETDIVRPQVYLCSRQFPARSLALVVRTRAGDAIAGSVRHAAKEVDSGQPVFGVRTVEELRADLFAPARAAGKLVILFGALSVCLAAIGIYSVLAYSVTARRKEFGIRMALGADRGSLLGMVTGQGMRLAGIGFALGIAASLATTRFMSAILYHVSPTDLPTFLLTSLLMLAVAAAACWMPASQAANADPARTLRQD